VEFSKLHYEVKFDTQAESYNVLRTQDPNLVVIEYIADEKVVAYLAQPLDGIDFPALGPAMLPTFAEKFLWGERIDRRVVPYVIKINPTQFRAYLANPKDLNQPKTLIISDTEVFELKNELIPINPKKFVL
jgi:hypothetical protein